jgi:hypothetical protein
MKTFLHLWQYLTKFFLEWDKFYRKFVEKIKTYFMFNNFFPKNHEIMSKNLAETKVPQTSQYGA